jgi:hypothetical protein
MSTPTSMNLREVPRLTAASAFAAIREEIRPNLLDKIIAAISPERGVQRMKSKAMLAMGGWSGMGGRQPKRLPKRTRNFL